MKATYVTILLILISFNTVFAHGMNKPGPHNGYVRMPGTYHVELVSEKNLLKVYILDLNFKLLPVSTATVRITLKGFKEASIPCTKDVEFYSCDTKEVNMKKFKEVLVTTSRDGEREATSTFKLPLSLK